MLLDESMHHFAFACRPLRPSMALASYAIPGPDRDVLCRRAAFAALAMDAGALATVQHVADEHGERLAKANQACVNGFAMGVLQYPAPLSNVDGLKSVFDLAMAEIVRSCGPQVLPPTALFICFLD